MIQISKYVFKHSVYYKFNKMYFKIIFNYLYNVKSKNQNILNQRSLKFFSEEVKYFFPLFLIKKLPINNT